MPVIVVRTALLHRAIDQGLDPTPGAIARAVGVSERTMRRALNGAPISAWTFSALRRLAGTDNVFMMARPARPGTETLGFHRSRGGCAPGLGWPLGY